jgi:hypothetical protein
MTRDSCGSSTGSDRRDDHSEMACGHQQYAQSARLTGRTHGSRGPGRRVSILSDPILALTHSIGSTTSVVSTFITPFELTSCPLALRSLDTATPRRVDPNVRLLHQPATSWCCPLSVYLAAGRDIVAGGAAARLESRAGETWRRMDAASRSWEDARWPCRHMYVLFEPSSATRASSWRR